MKQDTTSTISITLLLRRILYAFFSWTDSVLKAFRITKPRVIILCYHSIGSDNWRFTVSEENFQRQMQWLIRNSYEFLTLHDINAILSGHKKLEKSGVLITFDDGYEDVMLVKDWLRNHDIKPVIFILSHPDKAAQSEVCPDRRFISVPNLNSLLSAGWSVGCHSATHADFSAMDSEETCFEIIDAKSTLEDELGMMITAFAYPKGYYSDTIRKSVLESGYSLAFSMDDGLLNQFTDRLAIPRIGVDNSHSLTDFKGMISVSAVFFRKFVKWVLPQRLLNRLLGI